MAPNRWRCVGEFLAPSGNKPLRAAHRDLVAGTTVIPTGAKAIKASFMC